MVYVTCGTEYLCQPFAACDDEADWERRRELRLDLMRMARRQWALIVAHTPERAEAMYGMLPVDMYLTSIISADDCTALGIDPNLRADQIPMSRIDVIMSTTNGSVRLHLDPNALYSVQSTAEVGLWAGGTFSAHLGVRKLRHEFRKKSKKRARRR